ncbi:hypothetical protein ZHAS_00003244 [Anopheles sinensis]|uniref:Uncharacterized protein n=1 Tax=Anopheles sinensis TaxID=74873 RepID=A0A084VDY0_ANOSI|nr:hypothetical protein ZHAS_00003244 [Anopheles sinensis]
MKCVDRARREGFRLANRPTLEEAEKSPEPNGRDAHKGKQAEVVVPGVPRTEDRSFGNATSRQTPAQNAPVYAEDHMNAHTDAMGN